MDLEDVKLLYAAAGYRLLMKRVGRHKRLCALQVCAEDGRPLTGIGWAETHDATRAKVALRLLGEVNARTRS